MFGRRIALTTVSNKKPAEPGTDTMTLEEAATLGKNTILETVAGVASIVVCAAGVLTIMRMTEHYVKYYYR